MYEKGYLLKNSNTTAMNLANKGIIPPKNWEH